MEDQQRRRGPLIGLAVLAPIACLALGWWQWERFSSGGTFQNLGYAFQWPLFAVFCVYAYRRFVLLEANGADAADVDGAVTAEAGGPTPGVHPTGADLLPPRPAAARSEQTGALGEYNAYLASLAVEDMTRTDPSTRDDPSSRSHR